MTTSQHNQVFSHRSSVFVVVVSLVFSILVAGVQMLVAADNSLTAFASQDDQPDPDQLAANGIQVLQGKHLLLYADVRDRVDVDSLPEVFDLAVPQWCRYFGISPQEAEGWKLRGCVMLDPARFRRVGLFPESLPPFPAGFQIKEDIWMYLQPGNYYTRHLTLHEGTHAFMEKFLGGFGAPWYAEGMAELLALNCWQPEEEAEAEKLKIHFFVTDRDQVPFWGRIKPLRSDTAIHRALSLQQVIELPDQAFREVENYGWAWAACEFLSKHPASRERFREFAKQASLSPAQFNAMVERQLKEDWSQLARDWELFIHEIDYGADVLKSRLIEAETAPAQQGNNQFLVTIGADFGWQATSLNLPKGTKLKIRCNSYFQVGQSNVQSQPVPWTSSANGITLEYRNGFPLGRLLVVTADFEDVDFRAQIAGLKSPYPVGSDGTYEVPASGTLCFRVNDSPATMGDNSGQLEIHIEIIE